MAEERRERAEKKYIAKREGEKTGGIIRKRPMFVLQRAWRKVFLNGMPEFCIASFPRNRRIP